MLLIECVPNLSEGRRTGVIEACADAIRRSGVRLLDVSSDPAHNRSVYTFVGSSQTLHTAVLALFDQAVAGIDLRQHVGEHPRIGAVDVVPFVPLGETTMSECVTLAKVTAAAVANRYNIPVFLYEEAATSAGRRNLEDIRRAGFEGLAAKLRRPEWRPDYGPEVPHRSAGASVFGARGPLIAYNVTLATSDITVARAVASAVRQKSGGLPYVKAIGVELADRGIVQVSMNLTNYRETPIPRAFDAVVREADRLGVAVLESEIVGLVPADALTASPAALKLGAGFSADQILENRLRTG